MFAPNIVRDNRFSQIYYVSDWFRLHTLNRARDLDEYDTLTKCINHIFPIWSARPRPFIDSMANLVGCIKSILSGETRNASQRRRREATCNNDEPRTFFSYSSFSAVVRLHLLDVRNASKWRKKNEPSLPRVGGHAINGNDYWIQYRRRQMGKLDYTFAWWINSFTPSNTNSFPRAPKQGVVLCNMHAENEQKMCEIRQVLTARCTALYIQNLFYFCWETRATYIESSSLKLVNNVVRWFIAILNPIPQSPWQLLIRVS